MSTYVPLIKPPRAAVIVHDDVWSTEAHAPTVDVIEDAGTPHDTGLLDAAGVPLYRMPTREPIGFKL